MGDKTIETTTSQERHERQDDRRNGFAREVWEARFLHNLTKFPSFSFISMYERQ
jgi:hypothetical protein